MYSVGLCLPLACPFCIAPLPVCTAPLPFCTAPLPFCTVPLPFCTAPLPYCAFAVVALAVVALDIRETSLEEPELTPVFEPPHLLIISLEIWSMDSVLKSSASESVYENELLTPPLPFSEPLGVLFVHLSPHDELLKSVVRLLTLTIAPPSSPGVVALDNDPLSLSEVPRSSQGRVLLDLRLHRRLWTRGCSIVPFSINWGAGTTRRCRSGRLLQDDASDIRISRSSEGPPIPPNSALEPRLPSHQPRSIRKNTRPRKSIGVSAAMCSSCSICFCRIGGGSRNSFSGHMRPCLLALASPAMLGRPT